MNIWKAPLESFYSLHFYKKAQHSSVGKALGYLAYLALIVTFLFQAVLMTQWMPEADKFVEWFKAEMPTMTWTSEKISIRESSPYTMFHPEYGNMIVFNTEVDSITLDQMGDEFVHVTATKAYVRRGEGEIRVYDLIDQTLTGQPARDPLLIGPAEVNQYYQSIKPWIYFVLFLFMLPIFFIWKAIAAVFYALLGMIINQTRSEKLSFSQIYAVTLYAVTPATLIEAVKPLIPGLHLLPFGLLGSLIVTTLYLYLALKRTETVTS